MGSTGTSGRSSGVVGCLASRGLSRRRRALVASVLTVPAVAALGQSAAVGQTTVYWDANGTTTGAGATPAGTWGTDAFWNDQADGTDGGGAGTIGAWTDGDTAVFSAGNDATGAYTVTIASGSTQTAAGITVEDGTLTLAGGSIALTGTGPVTVNAGASAQINSSFVGSSQALTKLGPGTLTLNATSSTTGSSFGGGLDIQDGVVAFPGETSSTGGTFGPLGVVPGSATPGNVKISNGATLRSTRNSGTTNGISFLVANRGMTLGTGGGTLEVSVATSKLTYTGIITGNRLTKAGPGTLSFGSSISLANTFNGITVSGGTLEVGGEGSSTTAGAAAPVGAVPGSAMANYLTLQNGGTFKTLRAIGTSSSPQTSYVSSFLFANRGITLGTGGGGLEVNDQYTLLNYAGVIAGTAGNALTKTGPGGIHFQGANTYKGDTLLKSGMIAVNGTGTFGDGTGTIRLQGGNIWATASHTNALPNSIEISADASIQAAPYGLTSGTRTLAFGASSVTGTAGTVTISNPGKSAGGNTTTFAARFTGQNMTFPRPVVIGAAGDVGASQLQMYNEAATAGGAVGPQTWAGVISGAGGVVRSSGGTGTGGDAVLTAANTYAGGTQLNGGYLGVGVDSAGPAGAPTSGALGTGTLTINDDPTVGLFAAGAAHTLGNNVVLGTVANLTFKGISDLTLSGGVDLGTTARTLSVIDTGVTTLSGVVGNAANLTKSGTGTLVLSGNNAYTGTTTVSAGTLRVGHAAALGASAAGTTVNAGGALDLNGVATAEPVTLAGGALINDNTATAVTSGAAVTVTADSSLGGNGSLTYTGTLSGVGITKVGAGTTTLTGSNLDLTSLTAGAGRALIAAGSGTARVGTLAAAGGRLDVANNRLVLTATDAATLRGLLQTGRHDNGSGVGLWDGAGVISANAAADANKATAIGYLTAADKGLTGSTWGTVTGLAATDVITKYTYYGDINLDGTVNGDDYALMDRGMAKGLAAGTATWLDGDVNYDGAVTSSDYFLADTAFGHLAGVLSPGFLAQRESQFGSEYVSQLVAAVPEPTSLGLVAAGAAGLLGGRRRRGR